MAIVATIFGKALIMLVLWEGFETIALPRQIVVRAVERPEHPLASSSVRNRPSRALIQWRLICSRWKTASWLPLITLKTGWEHCSRLASRVNARPIRWMRMRIQDLKAGWAL
jgi:hypothetical protein